MTVLNLVTYGNLGIETHRPEEGLRYWQVLGETAVPQTGKLSLRIYDFSEGTIPFLAEGVSFDVEQRPVDGHQLSQVSLISVHTELGSDGILALVQIFFEGDCKVGSGGTGRMAPSPFGLLDSVTVYDPESRSTEFIGIFGLQPDIPYLVNAEIDGRLDTQYVVMNRAGRLIVTEPPS